MTERRPEIAERLVSMLIDHLLMLIIGLLIAAPSCVDAINHLTASTSGVASDFAIFHQPAWYFSLAGIALYLWKDVFNGRGIAKRLMYYQVVHNQTGIVANPLRCVVRNLTFIIWPVEVIMTLINPARRLGDMIAGTRVAIYDNKAEPVPVRWGSLMLSFILAYAVVAALSLPLLKVPKMLAKLDKREEQSYDVKGPYNNAASQQLNAEIDAKVGEYVSTTVHIFDGVDNDSTKYISCEFKWIGSYDDNEDARDSLCNIIEGLIRQEYPYGTYKGEAKFIYPSSSGREPVLIPLGDKAPDTIIDERDSADEMKPTQKMRATKDSVYVL